MDRNELLRELDRIIDVGIVNAKHDTDVLKYIRKQLTETDYAGILRILKKKWHGHLNIHDGESGKDIDLQDFNQSVVLCFDQEGRLIG